MIFVWYPFSMMRLILGPKPGVIISYTLYFVFLIHVSFSIIIRKVFHLLVQAHLYARYCRWTLKSFDGLLRISHPRETLRDSFPIILINSHAFYTGLCTECWLHIVFLTWAWQQLCVIRFVLVFARRNKCCASSSTLSFVPTVPNRLAPRQNLHQGDGTKLVWNTPCVAGAAAYARIRLPGIKKLIQQSTIHCERGESQTLPLVCGRKRGMSTPRKVEEHILAAGGCRSPLLPLPSMCSGTSNFLDRQVMLKSVGIRATCAFFHFFRGYSLLITEILLAARWCKSRCDLYLRINNVFKLDNFRVSILYLILLESTQLATYFTVLVKIHKANSSDTQ